MSNESATEVNENMEAGDEGKVSPAEYESSKEICARWKREVEHAEKSPEYKEWLKRCGIIRERYKAEIDIGDGGGAEDQDHRYNILWSNVQTMRPALYGKSPVPYIRRRYKDDDDIARVSSEILERASKYTLDEDEMFDSTMMSATDDLLLFAKGWSWNRYEFDQDEDGNITHQRVITEHVSCDQLIHNPAQGPRGLRWIGKKVFMRRDELKKKFKKVGHKIPLDHKPSGSDRSGESVDGFGDGQSSTFDRACIYEIWDKESGQIYWISKSFEDLIDMQEPEIKLQDFFPCPNPLIATRVGSMNPTPDYIQYRDQALELDELTSRIYWLTRAIKNNFAYDASCTDLGRLLDHGYDNKGIPISNWPQFQKQGGFRGVMEQPPIETTAQCLQIVLKAREGVLETIYAVTGIADIIRGNSSPSETATAQQIKSKFATLRLSERQAAVQKFVRDNLRIRAEIIAEMFTPETLMAMVNFKALSERDQPTYQKAIELLRADPIRRYRIEIETDSTIAADEEADKKERAMFTDSFGQLIERGLPMIQHFPAFGQVISLLTQLSVRGHKIGRTMEGEIKEALDAFVEEVQKPKPPQEDPDAKKAQMQMQVQMQMHQQDMQLKQQNNQQDIQLKMQKIKAEIELEREKNQIEMQKISADHIAKLAKIESDAQLKMEKMGKDVETKLQTAMIDAMSSQKVAEIMAKGSAFQAGVAAQSSLAQTEISAQGSLAQSEVQGISQMEIARNRDSGSGIE